MHILVRVVDNAAEKSDSHVDDRQEDDSHFVNGILIQRCRFNIILHDVNIRWLP